jgi:hypothetical protein
VKSRAEDRIATNCSMANGPGPGLRASPTAGFAPDLNPETGPGTPCICWCRRGLSWPLADTRGAPLSGRWSGAPRRGNYPSSAGKPTGMLGAGGGLAAAPAPGRTPGLLPTG